MTAPAPSTHDHELARAFDGQAAQFERSPLQSDRATLSRLVEFASFPRGSLVLDAGCGPGLLAEILLEAGLRVVGIDLSSEMIARAKRRCSKFGDQARFVQGSIFEETYPGTFDGAISRYVLHHVTDPLAFVRRQADVLRGGGTLVLCDHTTDSDPARSAWHQQVERARDHTHTANLTPGALVDALVTTGLERIASIEESFRLDFDEWFDRGAPAESKAFVRERILNGPGARGFDPRLGPAGHVAIECWRAMVRATKPTVGKP